MKHVQLVYYTTLCYPEQRSHQHRLILILLALKCERIFHPVILENYFLVIYNNWLIINKWLYRSLKGYISYYTCRQVYRWRQVYRCRQVYTCRQLYRYRKVPSSCFTSVISFISTQTSVNIFSILFVMSLDRGEVHRWRIPTKSNELK